MNEEFMPKVRDDIAFTASFLRGVGDAMIAQLACKMYIKNLQDRKKKLNYAAARLKDAKVAARIQDRYWVETQLFQIAQKINCASNMMIELDQTIKELSDQANPQYERPPDMCPGRRRGRDDSEPNEDATTSMFDDPTPINIPNAVPACEMCEYCNEIKQEVKEETNNE